MDSPIPARAVLAGLVLGVGLDFCAREYLLPWYRKRQSILQSTAGHERQRGNQFTAKLPPPKRTCRPVSPKATLHEPVQLRITEEDIANGVVLASNTSRKVVKIGEDIVVKFGSRVDLDEAESTTFIRENTTISVPRILDAYSQAGKNYIIMEYIAGSLLKDVWDNLSEEDRSVITTELRDFVCQMRQLPMPEGGLIGSVTGGLAVDQRQLGAVKGGPFPSETDFNEWQLAQLHPEVALSQREMYANLHKANHRIVFTHGDLAFHNIIVKDGHINAIIDWDSSGWYPEHWDYCKTRSFLGGTDEGYIVCKEIYEKQYHTEYFLDMWFSREVLHGGF